MRKATDILKMYLAYEFIAVGVVWGAIAVVLGIALVLWPALTCIVAGILLKFWPSGRIAWSWGTSSAVLGLLVAGYQAYAAIPFVTGTFSLVATESLVAFAIFAAAHVMLLYSGYSPGSKQAI